VDMIVARKVPEEDIVALAVDLRGEQDKENSLESK
jgi:hypothetical protein